MAQETGAFTFDDVAAGICEKMERRHPHVFGNAQIEDAAAQTVAWEEQKRRERAARGEGVLADVPRALPALTRASKLGKRAAQVGFEWPDVQGALDKVGEELAELRQEISGGIERDAVESELGDLLFSIVNICRYLKVDPEAALKRTNAKFERRFHYVEAQLQARGKRPEQATLEEMDALWNEGKKQER
jgi:tetrapyrrole methylase family protein/MazG family protein/ATP diphosphatase